MVNHRFAPYTLVHCAPSMGAAEEYDLWGSVAHWYTHLLDFFIEWELPPMTDDQLKEKFPILESSHVTAPLIRKSSAIRT